MARKTELQLSKVPNFSVYNKFGKVEFLEPVDLRNLDLTKIFKISCKKIEVYPDIFYSDEEKPVEGEELNKPAFLYFNDMKPTVGSSFGKYYSKIELFVSRMNAELISYDPEEYVLKIKVNHF